MSRIRKPVTAPYGRDRIQTHLDENAELYDEVEALRHDLAQRDEMIDELLAEVRALTQNPHGR